MTEYEVRGFTRKGNDCGFTVIARDIRHAITQTQELHPEMIRVKSVHPAQMWN